MVKKWIINSLRRRYQLGIFKDSELFLPDKVRYSKIQWISNPRWKDCWYADPFLLDVTNQNIIVLAEEFEYGKCKGRLSKLHIDRIKKTIVKSQPILELPTHLSFPYIYRENGITFVLPENYQSGAYSLYILDETNNTLTNPISLVSEPLVDTQLAKIRKSYYLFGTIVEPIGSPATLHIYKSKKIEGPYCEIQIIHNEKREERGCGQIFVLDDKLIRPAMSCEGGYGKEMILYELTIDNKQFNEKELFRLKPDIYKRNSNSFHTFNMLKGVCIVDGEDFNRPFFSKIYIPILYWIQGKRNSK